MGRDSRQTVGATKSRKRHRLRRAAVQCIAWEMKTRRISKITMESCYSE